MPVDPLELSARRAGQSGPMSLIALPAAQVAPTGALPEPVTFVPDAFYDLPRPRTLGRVRMPLRALILSVMAFVLLVALIVGFRLSGIDDDLGPTWFFIVTLASSEALLILLWVWLPRWILRRHHAAHVLRWRRPRRADLLWTVGALALMAVIWVVFVELANWGGWWWAVRTDPPDDWNAFPNWWVAAGVLIAAVILAPLIEETFFRGFILGGLNRVWWMIPSMLVSAALFSAVHVNLYAAIPFGLFGLILGALYIRTQHLTAPALAHAGWNLGVIGLWIVEYGVG